MIQIYDGAQLLEARDCRILSLPDGRTAALWRGLTYPLLASGKEIDVAGEAHPLEQAATPPPRPAAPGHTLVAGTDSAYLLVAGAALDAERAAADLRQAGFEVARTGRYLGEPVDGFVADWFVRVLTPGGTGALREHVAALFGRTPAAPEAAPDLRLRLLTAELAAARERALRAEAEADRLRLALAERGTAEADLATLRARLDGEQVRRMAAEEETRAVLARIAETPDPAPRPVPSASRRLQGEVEAVLAALLPRIRLLRDGIATLAVEFADRRTLYRVLAELEGCETAAPPRWKTVQGITGWIEKSRVANGQDDQGRVYARLDRGDRSWAVLVSHKSEQDRDLAWLGRQ